MLEIRRYKDSDEKKIRGLFKICFGRKMSHNKWLWKYNLSPWGSTAYVAIYNNQLISHYGAIRYPFQIKDKVFWAYQSCDAMTHPDHRGKFLGEKPVIAKAGDLFFNENAMDFTFGFPTERNARLLYLASGWSQHKKVALFRKQLQVMNKCKCSPYILEVGLDNISSDDLNNLTRSLHNPETFTIAKDSRYLLWRYMECPSEYYSALILKDIIQKEVKAIAFIMFFNNEARILDFFVKDGREVFSYFFIMLEYYVIKMQASAINIWLNSKEHVSKYLIDSGYEIIEDAPFSIRIKNDCRIIENDFFSSYSYRMGDLL
jgi:hypothetical protein